MSRSSRVSARGGGRSGGGLLGLLLLGLACSADASRYDVDYTVGFEPEAGAARVEIAVRPGDGRLLSLDLAMDESRYSDVKGDGEIERQGERVLWRVPRDGGALRYRYRVSHERNGGGYDALMTRSWALLRGDDLIPSARARTTRGADSRARLRFELPPGWTNVDTPYLRDRAGEAFVVVNAGRRFDRPVGWMIAGEVGTRREWIEGMEVSIAGPKGSEVRRNDLLAFIHAAGPEMKQAFGTLPRKLLIVGADDPMWRGGLSGPRSLYLHASRPSISENGTSTLMHELTHVITRIRGVKGQDWIAEGLAEYYSITLLQRAGLLSEARRDRTLQWMRNHGRRITRLAAANSHGPRTARAVGVFAALDAELRRDSDGEHDLDDVTQSLMGRGRISLDELREVAEQHLGHPAQSLQGSLFD